MSARWEQLCLYYTEVHFIPLFFVADGTYRKGDVRLVGGFYNWEGRVEIYWSGTWGAISDSSWTSADANVVCRQLQHSLNGNSDFISVLKLV